MENECQWENCSGGRYCPKHSLESQQNKHIPIEGIVEEFEKLLVGFLERYNLKNAMMYNRPPNAMGFPELHRQTDWLRTTLQSQADKYEREKREMIADLLKFAGNVYLPISNETEMRVIIKDVGKQYGVDLSE